MLSLSLPIATRAVRDSSDQSDHRVSAFLEGLLPEGNHGRQIATAAGVPPIDTMALLSRVGAERAGAVQFLAPGQAPTGDVAAATPLARPAHAVADAGSQTGGPAPAD